ncbi:MAG: acyl carrier protein, partial [Planctomycetes bacterium]|nr:acyl carrier protein [Planctomycetota bacterium]
MEFDLRTKRAALEETSAWLIALAAELLELPEEAIDPTSPLVRHGLDSVAAVQMTTAIAEKIGRAVPDWLLLDHRDIRSLARYMESARAGESEACLAFTGSDASSMSLIDLDSRLPDDIRPDGGHRPASAMRSVLLSGATGFLGG